MKNVAAALFIKNNSVLIAQRAEKTNQGGLWEFPGGKQEPHETLFECLEREIKEEFCVSCKATQIFCESIYTYVHGTIKLVAIFAELADEPIKLMVHTDYQWVKIKDLVSYQLAPADMPIAKKLIEVYGNT